MEKKIKITAIVAVCLLVILQISSMIIFSGDQIEDSEDYKKLAIENAESNSFYPDEDDRYAKFMATPGFINYLSLFYRIADSDKFPITANILLVIVMAGCIYFIAWKLFKNKTIAWLSLLLLAIFPTFIGEILSLRSEILFTTLAYAAVAIFLSDNRFKYIFCGVILALANWVRPLGLVFFLAIILYMIMTKARFINYIKLVSAVLVIVLLLGSATYLSSGYFDFQSVTGGVNFIMGANDDADGSYSQIAFRNGNIADLENFDELTYKEKDSIWISRSNEWIKQNPGKYIGLIPAKLYYMYAVDTYAFSTIYNDGTTTSSSEYISSLAGKVLRFRFNSMTWIDFVVTINQGIYMVYLILLILSFIIQLIKKTNIKEIIFLLAILIFGTGMTILTVGGARYHYPYLPIFFIMSAAFIYNIILKGNLKTLRKHNKQS